MLLKKLTAFALCIIFFRDASAQVNTIYINADEKPVEKIHAVEYMKVYKVSASDSYYKREVYDASSKKLLSEGWSKDEQGQIMDGDFKFWGFDGKLDKSAQYKDGKPEGEWILYDKKGKIYGKNHYLQGKMAGSNLLWYDNNQIADSFALDASGTGKGIGYYKDGKKRYEGLFKQGVKEGLWLYYYDESGNGKSMEITFAADSLISDQCFNSDGKLRNDCVYEKEAEFKGGNAAWQKYLVSKLTDVNFGKYMKHTDQYQVIVKFIVGKDGSLSDITIENPGDIGKLNKLAISIMEDSPRWEPGIQYNQKINAYRRQPISFVAE